MPIFTTLGAACAKAWGFTSGLITDQYFNLVSLLLPGNGTNGAQNNTFLDSSTNNFTITRNGNTTQGTFSPFSQTGWGNYFDGSGDYLSVSSNAAFGFGTGDFTIEYWIYPSLTGDGNQVVIDGRSSSSAIPWLIGQTTGGAVRYYDGTTIRTGGTMTANTWNHVAWCRASNVNNVYLNGTSVSTYTASQDFGSSNPLTLGSNINTATERTTGYISNLRIVKGTAVYTANFTPPTTPLTAISGTSLLTCQSNRFKDSSSNAFTITSSGGPTVVAFSPFAPTAAYTTAAVGGSGYFDGTRDYLTLPSTSNLAFGTGDFSIEAWVYPTSVVEESIIANTTTSGAGDTQLVFYIFNNKLNIGGWFTNFLTGSTNVSVNAWSHVVVCRTGTTMSLFLNGARDATGPVSNNFSSTNAFFVGAYPSGTGGDFNGYITNLRVLKGSSAYDPTLTQITVPTAPPTAVTNTQLLLNFTNAGITDATAKNDLETVGNAQISTSVSKFGGGSIAFDGTGDYLKGVYSPLMILSGDFTIECWLYYTAHGSYGGIVSFANSNTGAAPTSGWAFVFYAATNNLYFETGTGFNLQTTNTVPSGTWNHVAVVRSGSTITHYLNGTANGSGSSSATFTPLSTDNFVIGVDRGLASTITGYIDDLRVTRYARYTSNFTPPTAPFPVQ
jgi:hypothetical protein